MLKVIANLSIHPAVREHRFVRRAQEDVFALEPTHPVIGTRNTQQVELYGWAGSVPMHKDNHGYMYLLVLSGGNGQLVVGGHQAPLVDGVLIRMDDRVEHGTIQQGMTVAMFLGTFLEPCDEYALQMMQDALMHLKAGSYEAPRTSVSMKRLEADECFWFVGPENIGELQTLIRLRSDVDLTTEDVVTCGCPGCCQPAILLDSYFPYHWEGNVCIHHLHR